MNYILYRPVFNYRDDVSHGVFLKFYEWVSVFDSMKHNSPSNCIQCHSFWLGADAESIR